MISIWIAIFLIIVAGTAGSFVGLSDWFDRLMKKVGEFFLSKIEGENK